MSKKVSAFGLHVPITKTDAKKQIAYGWASVIEIDGEQVIDKQGDAIEEEELLKAVHAFVRNCRVAGEMHIKKGVGELVESIVFTKDLQDALGIKLKKVGWFVGFHVTDEAVWKRVESGELQEFSIGGRSHREEIE